MKWFVLALLLATSAFARNVEWFWTHDAAVPDLVRPGQVVTIRLYATWMQGTNFAESTFSIYDLGGAFFDGLVEIDESDGLGRSTSLNWYYPGNGTFDDSDGDGRFDRIDTIETLGTACFFACDARNPIPVYTIRWTAGATGEVRLVRGKTSADVFINRIYTNTFGASAAFEPVDEVLVFRVVDDCNGNGSSDLQDVLNGTSLDCNDNLVPDECEPGCSDDVLPRDCLADCNGNGLADACDLDAYDRNSGVLAPFGHEYQQSLTLDAPPTALGDVAITVEGEGDFVFPHRTAIVLVDEMQVGEIFARSLGACDRTTETVTVDQELFNGAVADGEVRIDIVPDRYSDPSRCPSWISIRVTYAANNDANGNGVPDDCGNCTADWNNDDVINGTDVLDYIVDYTRVRNGDEPLWDDPDLTEPMGVLNSADFLAFVNAYATGC